MLKHTDLGLDLKKKKKVIFKGKFSFVKRHFKEIHTSIVRNSKNFKGNFMLIFQLLRKNAYL